MAAHLTLAQVRQKELTALGLNLNATADQINAKLHTITPGTLADPRTGLPFTHETALDLGSGQALGQAVGIAGLGLTIGEVVAGLTRIPAAVATGEAATGGGTGAGASVTAGEAGSTAASVGAGASTVAKNATSLAKYGSILAALSDPSFVLRIVEVIAGLVLMFMGLRAITGNGSTISSQISYAKARVK